MIIKIQPPSMPPPPPPLLLLLEVEGEVDSESEIGQPASAAYVSFAMQLSTHG